MIKVMILGLSNQGSMVWVSLVYNVVFMILLYVCMDKKDSTQSPSISLIIFAYTSLFTFCNIIITTVPHQTPLQKK